MNDQKNFLRKRIEELEDAPKLLAIFIILFLTLLSIRPVGWQFYWAFLIAGAVTGAVVVIAIHSLSASAYRVASIFSVLSLVGLGLLLHRSVPVTPLGALLWGFAFSVPPKLLLVVFRRPLTTAIALSPGAMLGQEFIKKYFGPHPDHPVFGTIKGFDGGWKFHRALPVPGLGAAAVHFTINSDPNEKHVQNYESLRANWPTVWPLVFGRLKQIIGDYGYTEALSTSAATLSVHLPDELFAADTEWSVGLEFTPDAGIYDVQMRGWTEVTDGGATF